MRLLRVEGNRDGSQVMKRFASVLVVVVAAGCGTSPAALQAPTPVTRVTLSGTVSEVTPTGVRPLEGAEVWTTLTTPVRSSWDVTDASGRYEIILGAGDLTVFAGAEGYQTVSRPIAITPGANYLDFELRPCPTGSPCS